ncbi:unnamed protein product [Rhizoctonia solani]|uniref:Fungal-specific transcription factor domain protein n=1 Tax=Rhizoctonia solani TaxID=456999 RepID=A0A8H3B4L5_9AGAM|nr:unnamed protein product [Rhizoctonia solani]
MEQIENFFSPSTPGSDPFSTSYPPRSISPKPVPRQVPTPPYYPTDIGAFDEVTRAFSPRKKDMRQSMTFGQVGLFDALFSLDRLEDASRALSFLHYTSLAMEPMLAEPSCNLKYSVDRSIAPAIERNLKMRTMPISLAQNSATRLLWTRKSRVTRYHFFSKAFLFEPARIIPLAREYIIEEYLEGLAAGGRMMAISNAVRAITGSTGYTLEAFEVLEPHMYQELARLPSTFGRDPATGRFEALLAMSTTYEFISTVSVKVFPLSKVVRAMQVVAPILRRGCPDPMPINLPNLLSNINVGIEYFAMLDVLLNAVISRPMNFRYDTSFVPGVYGSVFDLEQGPGPRWCYGVPDRLVIIFARVNALLEDFGLGEDMRVVRELEEEIKEVKPIVVASADPSLAVGRLAVQESWRQAAYIYLYMGLCGANSHDARVIKAHDDFMEVFVRTKPGRIPDSFMVLPLPILGIATRHPDDQELLKRRMLALPECARRGTTGNQFIRMLECIWGLVNDSSRPTSWSDLRLASLYVVGV